MRGGGCFAYRALTAFGRPFHAVPLASPRVSAPGQANGREIRSRNPRTATLRRLHACGFRLMRVRSPLLAQSRLISFPPGT